MNCKHRQQNQAHTSRVMGLANFLYQRLFPAEFFVETACRSVISSDIAGLKPIEKKQFPWQTIAPIIRQNNLQYALRSAPGTPAVLPDDIQNQLVIDAFHTMHYAHLQRKECVRVIHALSRANIRFLIMKTYPVARHIFGKDTHKVPGDLDLLLPVSEIQKAARALQSLGYLCYWNHAGTHKNDLIYRDFYTPLCEHIFKKDAYTVELHTAIADTTYFSTRMLSDHANKLLTEDLFARRRRVMVGGVEVWTFSPTALFVSLFVHLVYQNNYQSAVHYYELLRVLEVYKKEIRWNEIVALITKFHLDLYFWWFASLFDDLFPDALPKAVLHKARACKSSFSIMQIALYYVLKFRLLHPKDRPFSDTGKRISWAIINGSVVSSAFSFFRRKIIG